MVKDDKKKKKKPSWDEDDFFGPFFSEDFNFDDFFDRFSPFFQGSFGRMIDEMIRQLMKSIEEGYDPKKMEDMIKQPFVFGFQLGVDPNGKPIIRHFGNVKPKNITGEIETKDVREPLVDVFKEKDKVRIIAEVPGVTKGDIKLTGTENKLTIKAFSKYRKYEKTIKLPVPVKIETAKAKYNNGVLEVVIERKEKEEDEGVEINIQ